MTHTGDKIYCAISIEIDILGTKALPKPILVYCQLDFKEQILVQFDQNEFFVYENTHLKMLSTKSQLFW